jgi:autotransporter-associated beta strand protein
LGTGLEGGTIDIGSGNAGTLTINGTALNYSTDRLLQLGTASGGSINLVTTSPTTTLTWGGTMQFNSGTPSVTNGSSITFSVGANNVRPFQLNSAGTIIFAGNIGNGTLSYGQLQKTGAGTVILTGSNSYQIGTTVNAGTLITATNFSNGTITNVGTTPVTGLNIANGFAQVQAKPVADTAAGFTVIPSIAVGSSSQFDLTNNGLDVYNTTSAAAQIRSLLKTGYASGAWNGVGGIVSSTAAAAASTTTKTALGYASGSELPGSTFGGHTIAATDTIVAYVLQGDANMDGTVNALDFNALATSYGSTSGDWIQGDFDYSNIIDSADFSLLAANYGKSLPTSAALPGAVGSLGSVVPEPATVILIGVMGGLLTMRRRSSRN